MSIEEIKIDPDMQLDEQLTISLDYDGTASTHPVFWHSFVQMAKAVGYRVIIVTMRNEHEAQDIEPTLLEAVDMVIATNRLAKREFVHELGIRVDIWVDDMPWAVYLNVDGTLPPQSDATRLMHPDFGTDIAKTAYLE